MNKTEKKKEIEERRKLVKKFLAKQEKSKKEIARELNISLSTLSIDIKSLEVLEVMGQKELIKDNLPEEKYKKMMIDKIISFYAKGEVTRAKKYLEMLEREIQLSDKEKENLYIILKAIQEKKGVESRRKTTKTENFR